MARRGRNARQRPGWTVHWRCVVQPCTYTTTRPNGARPPALPAECKRWMSSAPASGREEEEDELDIDALSFNDCRYWALFYNEDEDDRAFYDWYSAETWLPVAVEAVAKRLRAAAGREALDALDVGCGVSPLLFSLAEGAPGGWRELHGVDFAAAAVDFLNAEAAQAQHPGLRFSTADARTLTCCADASCDVLLDKGCLDCFITGDGERDVELYLEALQRVVRPTGRVLIVAVNGADVPHLLATGEVQPDGSCGTGAAARRGTWGERKREARAGAAPWTQRLWVEETVACAEKHLLVCTPVAPADSTRAALRCHECGRRHAGAVPDKCACGNRLRRFALS